MAATRAYEVAMRFTVNDKQFAAAVDKAQSAVNRLNKEYEDTVESQNKLVGSSEKLEDSFKKNIKEVIKAEAKYKGLPKEVERITNEFIRYRESMRMAELAMAKLSASGKESTRAYALQAEKVEQASANIRRLTLSLGANIEANERLTKSGMKVGKAVGSGFKEAGEQGKWFTEIVNDVSFKLFVLTFAGKQVFDTLLEGFVKVGEKVLLFEQRVKSLTGSTEAIQPLYEVVDRLGVGIDEAGQAFTRFAVANTTMGRTNQELVQMTETVLSFGLAAGGSIQEVTSGLQQLSQGLASNTLQGDELRSVMENLPLVAKALADEISGGSIAALRAMGSAGQLTGEKVSEALLKAHKRAVELAEALPDTTERAANRMQNAWSRVIAEMLKAVGGTSSVTGAFNRGAKMFDDFARGIERNAELVRDVLSGLGTAFAFTFGTILLQQLGMVGKAFFDVTAAIIASDRTFKAAMLLNPALAVGVGLLAGSLVALAAAFKDSRLQTDAANASLEEMTETVNKADAAQLRLLESQTRAARDAAAEKVRDAAIKAQRLENQLSYGGAKALAALNERRKEARAAVSDATEELAKQERKLRAVTDRQNENSKEAENAVRVAKELTGATSEYTDVLERLNPLLKEQNDLARDRKTLADAINPDNYKQIIPAIDALDAQQRDLAASAEVVAKAQSLVSSGYERMLHPKFNKELKERIDLMIAQEGVQVRISSGVRTFAEQLKAYRRHLAGGPLAAKPGTSLHETGKALDLVVEGTKKLSDATLELYGLKQLTYGNKSDHIHITMQKEAKALGDSAAAARDAAKQTKYLSESIKTITDYSRQYLKDQQLLNEEQKLLGYSTEELAQKQEQLFLAYQRQVEQVARANPLYKQRLELQEEEAKRLADLAKETEKAGKEAVTFEKLWTGALEEIGKDIQNELADAFEDLFNRQLDSAKDFFDSLKNIFKRSLAQLAAAVVQNRIVIPIMASMMPGAAGAAGTGGGLFGGGGGGLTGNPATSVFNGGGLGGLGQMFGGSSIGQSMVRTLYPAATNLLGSSQALKGAADALAMTPNWAMGAGGLAGGLAGNALFGDKGFGSIGSTIGSAAGAAFGPAALGAMGMALGPLGAIAGGLLGGVGGGFIGSLFGGGKPKAPGANLGVGYGGELELYGNQGVEANEIRAALQEANVFLYQLTDQLGGERYGAAQARRDFAGDYSNQVPGGDVAQWIEQTTQDIVKAMSQAYVEGIKGEALGDASAGAGKALSGLLTDAFEQAGDDPQALAQAVQYAQQAYAELQQIASGLLGSSTFDLLKLSGDAVQDADRLYTAAQRIGNTVPELVGNFNALAMAVDGMGLTAEYFTNWSAGFANWVGENATAGAGGLDKLTAGYQTFFNEFLSEAEQGARQVEAAKQMIRQTLGGDWALDQLQTRDQFSAFLGDRNLSSESEGQLAGQLISLAGYFDILYDAAERAQDPLERVEEAIDNLSDEGRAQAIADFLDSIRPDPDGLESWELLRSTMKEWGTGLPASAAALYEMAMAGEFTDDQILELAAHSEQLSAAFAWLSQNAQDAEESLRESTEALRRAAEEQAQIISDFTESLKPDMGGMDAWELLQRTMTEWGLQIPATSAALYGMIKAGELTEWQIIELSKYSRELAEAWAYVEQQARDGIQRTYQVLVESINSSAEREREAINRRYETQVDGYNKMIEAAQEYVSDLNSISSAIDSALSSLGQVDESVILLARERAIRELSSLADSTRIPGLEEIERIVEGLTGSQGSYGSMREAGLVDARAKADLELIQGRVDDQLSIEERTLETLQKQLELLADSRDRQLEALAERTERELEQAAQWRDDQLAALAELLRSTDATKEALFELADLPVLTPESSEESKHLAAQTEQLVALRTELVVANVDIRDRLRSIDNRLSKFDNDGLPPFRDSEDGTEVALLQVG